MRLPVNLALATLLIAGGAQARPATAPAPSGPAADYPVVVGEPYTIGSTVWTPANQLNYDAVGYAGAGEGLSGVSAAHKTLPLPSYAEVTALDTGRTILVRLVERGPMVNDTLIALSSAAETQLGLVPGSRAAVRVRRVNPPEVERAMLRSGGNAPMRMATPDALLKVLRRKLADQSPLMPPPSTPPVMPTQLASAPPAAAPPPPSKPIAPPAPKPFATPLAKPEPAPATPPPAPKKGTHIVQVAAFSSRERADALAKKLDGQVSPAGKLWRVRLGPFASSGEAATALEKAKAAGYSDARIQRAD